jgi:anti-sigma factor RsiW
LPDALPKVMKAEQEHLTEQLIARFQQRAMNPAERREVDAHVAACEDCLRRILQPATHSSLAYTALTEAFMQGPDEEPFHLSQEELKRFHNENLTEADRTIFESHLEFCSECKEQADELRAAVAAASTPASGRNAGRIEGETKARGGWLPGFIGRPLAWNRAASITAIIAVVGGLLLILALWLQQRPAQQRQDQAAQTEQKDNSIPPATMQNNSAAPAPTGELAGSNQNQTAPAEINNRDSTNSSPEGSQPDASTVVVSLRDGEAEVGLDSQGKLMGLEKFAPQTQRAVQAALATESLPKPQALSELAGPKINLMDQSTDGLPFQLIAPVGAVISSNRPTLRWQPLKGATSYTVSIFDSDFNRVLKSTPLTANSWAAPHSLQNGKLYSWEVTAMRGDEAITSPIAPAPQARFKILEAEKIREIAMVRKQQAGSHLTLGVLYARAGLLNEAEREFRALVNANPQSNVAKKLLHEVQNWRRR